MRTMNRGKDRINDPSYGVAGTDPTPMHENDEALMMLIGQGDPAAFSTLVARHMPRTVGMAWRMTGSRADGEDVAQDAFARVWLHAAKWQAGREGGGLFSTWLYRVVMNLCIDRARRPRSEVLDETNEPVDEHENAALRMEERDTAAQVAQAVRALPERQRMALVMCFYEGLSNGEAAAIMSLSVGAVESLLVRARRTLKDRLAGTYAELAEP